ncbi:A disintegrin and metalloproteinase with thrombospondin motifs adt-1-like [Strongylocentrotus purpuratus]|uniref:Hemicentin-1 n=1 Tax=Strongylocentrotus purpuratus TaxID=7668 RepID=A0A7M7P0X5_STRPU|nr:A disintegrin and metalloproteinase with thrombospondin motifs adt-1-like [Strongylocentrotus purpuratus]
MSCVGGTKTRYRSCRDKNGKNVGDCKGDTMAYDDCGSALCTPAPFSSYGIPRPSIWPKNFAEWTEWETWWDCSKTCDGGETVRYRDCEENGKWMPGCPGKDTNKKECNTQSCSGESAPPKPDQRYSGSAKLPSSSQLSQSSSQSKSSTKQSTSGGAVSWSSWSDWAKCSASCDGGTRTRWRECNDDKKKLASGCEGEYMDTDTCESTPCQSESSWIPWSKWTKCSASCDGGTRTRWRECNDDKKNLAAGCEGEYMDTGTCGSTPCQSESSWTPWSEWTKCSASCDGGTRTRWRECNDDKKKLATGCEGEYMDTGTCESTPCQSESSWTPWSEWTKCSASCDDGTRTRWRECNDDKKNLATGCEGEYMDTGTCESTPCQSESSWTPWSEWTKCSASCDDGTRTRWRECNDDKKNLATGCEGEYMDTGTCESTPCQSESSWTPWSEWTKCSASCDGGSRTRWRECNDAKRNLATGCEGEYMDESDCGSAPCVATSSSPKQPSSGSEVKNWSTWNDWSSCSATCGGGTRSRLRECEGPNESLAVDCEGGYMESSDCGSQPCQSSFRAGSIQGSPDQSKKIISA